MRVTKLGNVKVSEEGKKRIKQLLARKQKRDENNIKKNIMKKLLK